MEFRFRYLGPEGGEVEVSSLEDLRALVAAGTVGDATVLYDALTKEWAPARSHAVYRFMRDEAARSGGAQPQSVQDDLGLGIKLSLQEAPHVPDADEAVRDLLKERERDAEPVRAEGLRAWNAAAAPKGLRPSAASPGVSPAAAPAASAPPASTSGAAAPMAASSEPPKHPEPTLMSSWEREAAREPMNAAPAASARSAAPSSQKRTLEFTTPVPKVAPHPPRPVEQGGRTLFRTVVPAPAKSPRTFEWGAASLYKALHLGRLTGWLDDFGRHLLHSVGPRALPGTLVLVGLVGLLYVMLSTVRDRRANAAEEPARASVMAVRPEVGRLMNRFASAEESGFQSMVAGVDSLRAVHGIAEVPRIWLEGAYLADAHRYPQVEDFWTRYQAFLHEVQSSETALFRAGFVRSLEAQGIGGAVLSLRLSQAMREFERSQPQRDDVYRHMEELSSAALHLHGLLVDRAEDITYEPAIRRGSTISREPVVEAVAEDSLLKDHMWALLERIFASLEWMGGDLGRSRDNLTERLLEGIEASAR